MNDVQSITANGVTTVTVNILEDNVLFEGTESFSVVISYFIVDQPSISGQEIVTVTIGKLITMCSYVTKV